MGNETILRIDLFDNAVTENKGDCAGRCLITGSLQNLGVAERIVAKRTEYRLNTIVNILDMADEEKIGAIAEGKSVVDGVGQYQIVVNGPFKGEKSPFDPKIHSLSVSYAPSKRLRDALKAVKVETRPASTGPVINDIINSTTDETNLLLTSGSAAVINGSNIKVAGEDPSVGVFFTLKGGTPAKATLLIHNNPSQLTVLMPVMADGEYTLSITTQYSTGNRMVKEPRTYTLPLPLYVGKLPESGGNDRPDEV